MPDRGPNYLCVNSDLSGCDTSARCQRRNECPAKGDFDHQVAVSCSQQLAARVCEESVATSWSLRCVVWFGCNASPTAMGSVTDALSCCHCAVGVTLYSAGVLCWSVERVDAAHTQLVAVGGRLVRTMALRVGGDVLTVLIHHKLVFVLGCNLSRD